MASNRVTWAALFAIMAVTPACSTTDECNTDQLPADDPCFNRGCCEVVNVRVLPDGTEVVVAAGDDGGTDSQQRFCGACNG